jgi:hypothetical protein
LGERLGGCEVRKLRRWDVVKLGSSKLKAQRGTFGCLRSASLEVRDWRQKRYNFLFSSFN